MSRHKRKSGSSHKGYTEPQRKPQILTGLQYNKSVTFQVMNAPAIYNIAKERPHMAIIVDVRASQLTKDQPDFEVELILQCRGQSSNPPAGEEPTTFFETSLTYAGIFTLVNSTPESLEPQLLVDAPHILFPGARHVLSTLSREAGFLPVIIQKIDFAKLWQERKVTV
ncbi:MULTISPECIES: protein-export chaperone SecB [Acetobacter]|uniref:Protein-export chaperone SecB n=1 Tax=Acetobacter thailandicus TaxID=1502842 RepID=A0ABT3QGH6_9PROT|nr:MULTISPECIES: protein-export chaperone SecB [Acetobacter]MBS0960511.1 protein-export chaperone SecB [Acetobacter thailandicus]MBS0986028.1 protein-export chaperone SecB [Acetobacter thailandicus]MBS1002931.1 protein-export chaperone SecB [Acetobacter thailandicus]MCX2564371.1 protein-export chaperone SecB [Acetobacter thailandicus]NHN95354.1 preprotein translocase subunit SecB [Acetobacter thailandicus]